MKKKTKTQELWLWAAMNYDVIWGVGYNRKMARYDLSRQLQRRGRTALQVEAEIDKRLKDGSLSIRRCYVRVT